MKMPVIVIAVILWIAAIGCGLAKLYQYEFGAGQEIRPALHWPMAAGLKFQKGVFNYVLVMHPHCPCSRATLGELEIIMARSKGKVAVNLLFVKPKEFDESWVKTDLFMQAKGMRGVQVYIDNEGKQAQIFGGATSGEGFLYDEQGALVFSGGITSSRGHSGDNVGRASIVDLIHRRKPLAMHTKSFGCSVRT